MNQGRAYSHRNELEAPMKDLLDAQAAMKFRQSVTKETVLSPTIWKEPHVTIPKLEALWGFSDNTIREWFRNDPEVLVTIGPNGKERMSIPNSVVERVYNEHRRKIRNRAPKRRALKQPVAVLKPVMVTRANASELMPRYGTGPGGVSSGPSSRSFPVWVPGNHNAVAMQSSPS